MGFMETTDVLSIMERTLNHIDTRLINHGRRVAYLVYQILKPMERYSERELRDICIAALLHDIGAYKTEEIDRMVAFETQETSDHAIYGYLFLKHFSPLSHLADVILYHHTSCVDLERDAPHTFLAQVIFLADRLDIFSLSGVDTREGLLELLNKSSDTLFYKELVDYVLESDIRLPVTDEMVVGDSEINRVIHSIPLTHQEILDYLKMIVLFTDFRSHQTLTHTIVTTSISNSLAKLCDMEDEMRMQLIAGSWLHDIGKTGVPLHILEKPSHLTDQEMATIKQHVRITNTILKDTVLDKVRLVAKHHHEKLDGSGYPDGLCGDELSLSERIAVVSDIFSALCGVRSYKNAFPKDEVIFLLAQMKNEGLLDSDVVDKAVDNYDTIMATVEEHIRPFDKSFKEISTEYTLLQKQFETQNSYI